MVLFEHREGILGKDQGGVKVKSSRIDHAMGGAILYYVEKVIKFSQPIVESQSNHGGKSSILIRCGLPDRGKSDNFLICPFLFPAKSFDIEPVNGRTQLT